MIRTWVSCTSVFVCLSLAAGCESAPDPPPGRIGQTSSALTGLDGNAYVNYHRDRLLDAYAAYKGLGDRVNAWNSLNPKQKDLFLIQTDLLGNRTFMVNDDAHYWIDPGHVCGCPSCTATCDAGCQAIAPGANEYCVQYATSQDCVNDGVCTWQSNPRTDFTMALEHVVKPYELLAPNGNCGGDDNNRIFWQADDPLIQVFRNRWMGLPEWDANGDLGGPHSPFNNASSTLTGRPFSCDGPDGQAQFYSYDTDAVSFTRGSAWLPADGKMFELDDDYDTFHNSSPECDYCGGSYGRTMYEQHWCLIKGNGAPCDWGYMPSP